MCRDRGLDEVVEVWTEVNVCNALCVNSADLSSTWRRTDSQWRFETTDQNATVNEGSISIDVDGKQNVIYVYSELWK